MEKPPKKKTNKQTNKNKTKTKQKTKNKKKKQKNKASGSYFDAKIDHICARSAHQFPLNNLVA